MYLLLMSFEKDDGEEWNDWWVFETIKDAELNMNSRIPVRSGAIHCGISCSKAVILKVQAVEVVD